jgi:hypothetical protein
MICRYEGFILFDKDRYAKLYREVCGMELPSNVSSVPMRFEQLEILIEQRRKDRARDPYLDDLPDDQLVQRGPIGIGKLLARHAKSAVVASASRIDYNNPCRSTVFRFDWDSDTWTDSHGCVLRTWFLPLAYKYHLRLSDEEHNKIFAVALYNLISERGFERCQSLVGTKARAVMIGHEPAFQPAPASAIAAAIARERKCRHTDFCIYSQAYECSDRCMCDYEDKPEKKSDGK